MNLAPSEVKLIHRAKRFRRAERIIAWGLILCWPVWTYLAAQGALPRLELPLATALLIVAVAYLARPVVDARVLDVLEQVVRDDESNGH